MILLQNEVVFFFVTIGIAIIVFSMESLAVSWLLNLRAGNEPLGLITGFTLQVAGIVVVVAYWWNSESIADRIGLIPSMRTFISAYHKDPDKAVKDYSLEINDLQRGLWRNFMSEFRNEAKITDIDHLNCIGKRDDIRDITHIYAIQYVCDGEKRVMLFGRHDKSGGLFVPCSLIHLHFAEMEIASYERAEWKYVR